MTKLQALSIQQIVLYRGMAVFIAVGILIVGIAVRLTVVIPNQEPGTKCIAPDVTQTPNSTFQFCNETFTILSVGRHI